MGVRSAKHTSGIGKYGATLFAAGLGAIVVIVVATAVLRRDPETALVLATRHDCLRAFAAQQCDAIVETAFAIHARTAPRFVERRTCDLSFGPGACREIADAAGKRTYAPSVAVILATRDGKGEERSLVPLYAGPPSARESDGRRVYFRGLVAGVLSSGTYGGADISRVVGLNGKPITSAAVKKLRAG